MDSKDFDNQTSTKDKRMSRRTVLAGMATAVVGTVAAAKVDSTLNSFTKVSTNPSNEQAFLDQTPPPMTDRHPDLISIQPTPTEVAQQPTVTPIKVESTPTIEQKRDDLLNQILAQEAGSDQRFIEEKKYLDFLDNLHNLDRANIDRGLSVIGKSEYRKHLLDMRSYVRQLEYKQNKRKDIVLENKKLRDWADQLNIDHEVLGMCFDTYSKAAKVIHNLQQYLKQNGESFVFEGRKYSLDLAASPYELMINPGGMAYLLYLETSNLQNIGSHPAADEINKSFTQALDDLPKLEAKMREYSHLNYGQNPKDLPGSSIGDPKINVSGGAIGDQFMPNQAYALQQLLEKVGFQFNPMDPESALVGAWVYLSLRKAWLDFNGNEINDQVKHIMPLAGYRLNRPQDQEDAIKSWNPFRSEIENVRLQATYVSDHFSDLIRQAA